jgi:hypothetical protein
MSFITFSFQNSGKEQKTARRLINKLVFPPMTPGLAGLGPGRVATVQNPFGHWVGALERENSTFVMGDHVCNDLTELKDITSKTTSRNGRCPECERLLEELGLVNSWVYRPNDHGVEGTAEWE